MQKSVKKQNGFLKGVFVLSVGGVVAKLLGAVYRIPLTNIIGSYGMGLYQLVFPLFSLLLTISTAGIPVAVSKLVAEKVALGQNDHADKVFKTALAMLDLSCRKCAVVCVCRGDICFAGQRAGNVCLPDNSTVCFFGLCHFGISWLFSGAYANGAYCIQPDCRADCKNGDWSVWCNKVYARRYKKRKLCRAWRYCQRSVRFAFAVVH